MEVSFVPDGFHRVRLADAGMLPDDQVLFLVDEMTGRQVSQHRGWHCLLVKAEVEVLKFN